MPHRRGSVEHDKGDVTMVCFLCLLAASLTSAEPIERAARLLEQFQVEPALDALEHAQSSGPFSYEDYVRLFEQRGIAYAYLGNKPSAAQAFDMVLALDPGHAISYTLSPKVTFLFESARAAARGREVATVLLSWPHDLAVQDMIPVTVELAADPARLLARGQLFTRLRGQSKFAALQLAMPAPGAHKLVTLAPLASTAKTNTVAELYFSGYDQAGNEVLRVGDPMHPRTLELRYEPPIPWYRKWWVWAATGGILAASTGALVYAKTHEPPATVTGQISVH